jgi:hypothetical protein
MSSRGTSILNCLAFFAALGLSCVAIHAFLPTPHMEQASEKLAYFAQHKDEFDTLFIGSSRTRRGIVPVLFDKTLAAQGIRCRSLNLGVDAMAPPEQFWMIRHVLDSRPKSLKRLFVELSEPRPEVGNTGFRGIYWRDWEETAWLARKHWQLAQTDRDKPFKVPKNWGKNLAKKWNGRLKKIPPSVVALLRFMGGYGENAGAFIRCQSSLGYAVQDSPADGPGPLPKIRTPQDQAFGYDPLTGVMSKPNDIARYRSCLRRIQSSKEAVCDSVDAEGFAQLFASARAAGVEPYCFVTPALKVIDFFPPRPPGEKIFAFNDPQKYPQLYSMEWRWDYDHLNDTGAREFTMLLANDFAGASKLPAPPMPGTNP